MPTLSTTRIRINPNKNWWQDLLLLSLLLGSAFGLFLNKQPLLVYFPNEAHCAEISREMAQTGHYLVPQVNGIKSFYHPPLLHWMQAACIRLFGVKEWAVRLPSTLLALLTALAVYVAGRILYTRRTGLLASLILSSSLLYCYMAHLATLHITLTAFLSYTLLAFLIAVHLPPNQQRRLSLYIGYVCLALAVLAGGLITLLFPILIIGLWVLYLNQWYLLKQLYLPSAALLFFLLVAPWYWLIGLNNPGVLYSYFLTPVVLNGPLIPVWEVLLNKKLTFTSIVFALGFFPWIAFLPRAIIFHLSCSVNSLDLKKKSSFLLIWVVVVFALFILILLCPKLSCSSPFAYLLPIFPAVALLIGNCFDHYWNKPVSALAIKLDYLLLPVFLISAIGLFIWIEHRIVFRWPASTLSYNLLAYGVLLLSMLMAPCLLLGYGPKAAFSILALGSMISTLIICAYVPKHSSVKSLANTLKSMLKSTDRVVAYGCCYHDLPFYLHRHIIAVQLEKKLKDKYRLCTGYPNTSSWTLTTEQFHPLWTSSERVFLLAPWKTYEKLIAAGYQANFIKDTNFHVLLSNQRI